MIDETIKQVTHKLHQTIMTSDIDNFDPDRTTGEIPNKSMTTPSSVNPRQNSNTTHQFHKTPNLQSISSEQGNHIVHKKQTTNICYTPIFSPFGEMKQIIMDIDRLYPSDTLHNQIMESLNCKGLCKYNSLCRAYVFKQSANLVNCAHLHNFQLVMQCIQTHINGTG